MKNKMIDRIFILIIIVSVCVSCDVSDPSDPSPEMVINEPWSWENPYSFESITILEGWRQTNSEQLQEAMLTLQHSSGRSLVYIMNGESLDNLSLEEYLDVIKPFLSSELGIDQFDTIEDPEMGQYAQASGAKYMGDTLAGTYIRIWMIGEREFWRSVSITNMEYKSLEYEARGLVELLMKSSNP